MRLSGRPYFIATMDLRKQNISRATWLNALLSIAFCVLLPSCKSLPLDVYTIPAPINKSASSKVNDDLLKQAFRKVCVKHGLRENVASGNIHDNYIGIISIYIKPRVSGDRREFMSVIFSRDEKNFTIIVRTDGGVEESRDIKLFKSDLMESLRLIAGDDGVIYKREFGSEVS